MQETDCILRLRSVLARSGLSRSTLYRKIKNGTFPEQVRIGEYCSGWRESELNRWIADPPAWRASRTHARTKTNLVIIPRTMQKNRGRADD